LVDGMSNPHYWETVFAWLILLAIATGMLSWLYAFINLLRVPYHVNSGHLRGWLSFMDVYLLFYLGQNLTSKGYAIRRQVFFAMGVFVLSLIMAVVARMAADAFAQPPG